MSWRPWLLGWRPSLLIRLEAIAIELETMALRLEAIALRLEAIAIELETMALRLEAIAIRNLFYYVLFIHSFSDGRPDVIGSRWSRCSWLKRIGIQVTHPISGTRARNPPRWWRKWTWLDWVALSPHVSAPCWTPSPFDCCLLGRATTA